MKKRRASLPEKKPVRPVIWVGDSKKQLKKMPDEVQDQLGGELYLAQIGLMPPMPNRLRVSGAVCLNSGMIT